MIWVHDLTALPFYTENFSTFSSTGTTATTEKKKKKEHNLPIGSAALVCLSLHFIYDNRMTSSLVRERVEKIGCRRIYHKRKVQSKVWVIVKNEKGFLLSRMCFILRNYGRGKTEIFHSSYHYFISKSDLSASGKNLF